MVQQRSMDVGHVMTILDGMEPEFVCGAMCHAASNAAAGHPDSKTVRMPTNILSCDGRD